MNEESIFASALQIESLAERQAYLDSACGDDPQLRAQVQQLLEADADAGSFLNHPLAGVDATVAMTDPGHDTTNSGEWAVRLSFLQPCDTPGRIGKLVGKGDEYEISEVVGQGGMGAVLRAFDVKLSRVVAVKVMAPELAANPTAVKRFLREARAAAAVHHDHVVTIHAVDETHQPPFLVMQFVEGQTLQQKIDREGGLPLNCILRIGSQVAAGLAAAHKHGLVHRDVKPGNILLENGVERVKITDFGLARAADDLEMTQTGTIAGTPQYMSPEQATGGAIDTRSDLFSLGSVLYSMCTGRTAFRADNTLAVLRRVCDDAPRPIREVNPEIPEWLAAIVGKLLAKNPADRFQTAGEVAELLGQHLAHLQSPAVVPRPASLFVPQPAAFAVPAAIPPKMRSTASGDNGTVVVAVIGIAFMILVIVAPVLLIAVGLLMPRLQMRQNAVKKMAGSASSSEIVGSTNTLAQAADAPPVDLIEWGKFLDPRGDCRIERQPGLAVFHLPGTAPYNLSPALPEGMTAPRLLHEAEGDFVLQVRIPPFAKAPANATTANATSSSWRSAGLVLLVDEQTVVRVERASWGERKAGAPMAHVECFRQGDRAEDHYGSLSDDERSTLLQMERRGDVLFCRYSDDGTRWEEHQLAGLGLPQRVLVGLVATHPTPTKFDPAFEDLRFRDAAGRTVEFPAEPGWTQLFNGQDLTGWQTHPDVPGAWAVQDNALVGRGANQYLYSARGDYKDFRLRAEVRINAQGDSGILVRMAPPGAPPMAESGYEVQLVGDPAHVSPTATIIRHGASVVGRGVVGRRDLIRPGEWFALEISAIDGKLAVAIDGREVVNYRDDPPRPSGHIALQSFSDATEVFFRKIEIQEIKTEATEQQEAAQTPAADVPIAPVGD